VNEIKNQTFNKIILLITNDYSKENSVSVINSWIEETGFVRIFLNHDLNFRKGHSQIAKGLSNKALSFPFGSHLIQNQYDYVVKVEKEFIIYCELWP